MKNSRTSKFWNFLQSNSCPIMFENAIDRPPSLPSWNWFRSFICCVTH
jgi:hypothetical protein